MSISFFMAIKPPTSTHQMKKVAVVKGKPKFYEPKEVKDARMKFRAHLSRHANSRPADGPVRLLTKWCFPIKGNHKNGEYKTSKPDTDNMVKLLKDEMTLSGFWKDDAQVASEVTEKFWADIPGIYVQIESLED